MKLGANHPMGPLALGDLIGLDIVLAIMEVLQAETGDPKYRPEPLLRKMVRAGKLGQKTASASTIIANKFGFPILHFESVGDKLPSKSHKESGYGCRSVSVP